MTRPPYAITMWDFSWLERRWPGAGYEDWNRALDELLERGYNAIRMDAFPHLVGRDPGRSWILDPVWDCHDWGAPCPVKVTPGPALVEFIEACASRNIRVLLSTWFRKERTRVDRRIPTPEAHAELWVRTIAHIEAAGLIDTIIGVDLCNEWPIKLFAPFYRGEGHLMEAESIDWMRRSIASFREHYPQLPATFSWCGSRRGPRGPEAREAFAFLDFLEPHIWMAQADAARFYKTLGYEYIHFGNKGYNELLPQAEGLYRENPDYWLGLLDEHIHWVAEQSEEAGKRLMTTECWAVVDYKDWPGLDWGWIKELCAHGLETALATGRWDALATSNFCGPQFRGMWEDIEWHQRQTRLIHLISDEDTTVEG
jgi:lysophospholipase L1-like esterase